MSSVMARRFARRSLASVAKRAPQMPKAGAVGCCRQGTQRMMSSLPPQPAGKRSGEQSFSSSSFARGAAFALGGVLLFGLAAGSYNTDEKRTETRNEVRCEQRNSMLAGYDVAQPGSTEKASPANFGPHFIADAAEKAIPALVNISSIQNGPWGQMVQSAGSGFVIRSDGLIATNAHVVKGASSLTVTLNDGRQYQGRVYATDQTSDLALVIVTDILEEPLPIMHIGDSGLLRPGEFVVALGSPLNLGNSVTAGIVSSTARAASEIGIMQARTDYIQTDAAINQGNSGGPLINLDGQVVGINTMKVAGGDGIGFAIPINTAWVVLSQLRDTGKVIRPYLGLRMAALNRNLARFERRVSKRFPDVESGLLVVKVAPNSPASRAGLKPGDVIVEFDGKKVKSVAEMTTRMAYEVGKTFDLTVVREGGQKISMSVTTEALNL
ncbi:Serine protease HTRA1 [Hondaea fermentalgiana]|uniref:Serine protease HTRA1 n=1 Tax=Hondaea fermentalgiana TaxID=2315210 RepID=A0A2R5GTT0_9STRA|nr:Serine protease HTRA1 [Hondaea fermentalgiana]|eukprot:GBG33729.1 Serine protease HTRA1 [Hondaea fermentalgiana]